MRSIADAQCLLFEASPDDVLRTLERLGAKSDHRTVWYYPRESAAELRLTMFAARQADSERLDLGDTIHTYVMADLTFESWQAWFTSLAHAANLSDDEAVQLLLKKTNVLVDCEAFDVSARLPLHQFLLALARLGDGLVWTGERSCSFQAFAAQPSSLDVALWGDAV